MYKSGKFYIKLAIPDGDAFPTHDDIEVGCVHLLHNGENIPYIYTDSGWMPIADYLSGDVSVTDGVVTVEKLQGREVSVTVPSLGQALIWNGSVWIPSGITGGSGVGDFLSLSDTPSSFVGYSGYCVAVNSAENALEFIAPSFKVDWANTLIVDSEGGGDYTTITDAVTAATSGDVILLTPGTYVEDVTLPDGVSLCGIDLMNCIIDGQVTVGDDCYVSDFKIEMVRTAGDAIASLWGLYVYNAGPFVGRNIIIDIENQYAAGSAYGINAVTPSALNSEIHLSNVHAKAVGGASGYGYALQANASGSQGVRIWSSVLDGSDYDIRLDGSAELYLYGVEYATVQDAGGNLYEYVDDKITTHTADADAHIGSSYYAALAGTYGSPGAGNKYVTGNDVPATPAANRGVRLGSSGQLSMPSGGIIYFNGATSGEESSKVRILMPRYYYYEADNYAFFGSALAANNSYTRWSIGGWYWDNSTSEWVTASGGVANDRTGIFGINGGHIYFVPDTVDRSADPNLTHAELTAIATVAFLSSGNVGIGTITSPHGGVGSAMLSLDGANASSSGPHIQITTASDDYPTFQMLNWAHDNTSLVFDAYYDVAWKSSDAGSNYMIRKNSDILQIQYDSGVTAGSTVTWNNAMAFTTSGHVGIINGSPDKELSFSNDYFGVEPDSSSNYNIVSNCYWDGSNWKTSSTGYGSDASRVQFSGDYILFSIYNGTAANQTITWTDVLSLHPAGDVLMPLKSRVRVNRTLGQNISNATWTVIQYDTENWDPHGEWDHVTNYRFSPDNDGYFRISASVAFASTSWTSGEIASLAVYRNAAVYAYLDRKTHDGTATRIVQVHGTTTVYLTSSDYIDIRVYQSTGGVLATNSSDDYVYCDIERIG